jgi:D-alanyl-D-alanine carboxypeptidase (penicillin-binding protein 5/6)
MNGLKNLLSLILTFTTTFGISVIGAGNVDISLHEDVLSSDKYSVKSAYLIEASTGAELFSLREDEGCAIASVTKVMTLLLVMEALDKGQINLDQTVYISKNAASMGGSQVFLEEGEMITVEELIKCAVIASANDASVALAELVSGSEDLFVEKMNEKAGQLKLLNTYFENTTGLDDTTVNHHSCAKDVAAISKELVKYDLILKYSSTWQDSIRNGEMTLTNTNRLIRYYDGCNGLKTGSTDKAGFCISVTAKRGNMQLIAVVLGAKTKDERNTVARELLDYGFANYALFESPEGYLEDVYIRGGKTNSVALYKSGFNSIISKGAKVEEIYEIPEYLIAPVEEGKIVGKVVYKIGDMVIGESTIYVNSTIEKMNLLNVIAKLIKKIIVGV